MHHNHSTVPLTNHLGFLYDIDKAQKLQIEYHQKITRNQNKALFISEKLRVDFVYNTIALEGNPYTYPEIKTLIEGITVGGHKVSDTEQVLNLNKALSYVVGLVKNHAFYLNKETACAIQNLVAQSEALTWGRFRDGQVYIGGTDYIPPQAAILDDLFDQGIKAIHQINSEEDSILKAWLVFLWGSLNQFFYDGNKRTSRLLANGILLSDGLPPLTIYAKHQLVYNQIMMEFYNTQDATNALEWLYEYYYQAWVDF